MRMEEIEHILGNVIVGALQRAVRDAFAAADAHSDREAGADAVRALRFAAS